MKQKLLFFAFLLVWGLNTGYAQTESDGFVKLDHKEYVQAKKIFSALLKTNPKNAAAFYGLGQYYYFTGKTDSAKICYQNGLDANSSYASNYAGLGKVSLASSPADAEEFFKTAIKKSKKDATALVEIAKMYYDMTPKKLDDAKRYVNLAIGVDAKNANAYFLNGLIDLDQNNQSDASLQFDRAIYFNPHLMEAYLYQSKIISSTRNLAQAIEYLNKAIAVNSNYWQAYKNLGELYYDNQKYPEAVSAFATYFKNVPEDKDVTHYAYSLFFNKQYDEAHGLIEKLVEQNPNDYVLLRLLGYISYEKKDLINGKMYLDKFFSLVPTDKILANDYSYYGKMLSANGNDSLAIINYKLSLKKDSTQFQILDDLAKSYNKMKNYDESLKYSAEFLKNKTNRSAADYFQLGKIYFSTANQLDVKVDSLKQLKYYHAADSLFNEVITFAPTSYLGVFWRARVNSAIDKETTLGLAKPYYEAALEILIKDPVKYKLEISEIYAYLGFYYYQKDDKPTSLEYWKKLLELEPDNLKAQEAIKALEKK